MVYNEGMRKRAKVLWIDLEMTGLEPMEDRILEVAAIATDWNFTEIARYEAVVKVDDELMQRRMVGEFWEKYTDVREALVKQNETGKSVQVVEDELLAFLDEYFAGEERVLMRIIFPDLCSEDFCSPRAQIWPG